MMGYVMLEMKPTNTLIVTWGHVNRFGPKLVNMYQDYGGILQGFLDVFNVSQGSSAGHGRLSESAIVR